MSSSVRLPMAETTTTTSSPSPARRATRPATWRMRSASATEVPPYFCTVRMGKEYGSGGLCGAGAWV